MSTYDTRGGAAKAAIRLGEGLLGAGHEVKMLVQIKGGNADFVHVPDHFCYRHFPKFRGYLDLIPAFIATRKKILFSSACVPSKTVLRMIHEYNPDIIHLNWFNKGFVDLDILSQMTKPIVWTLHDMWALTGGCHSPIICKRYEIGCGSCPIINSRNEHDLSSRFFERKKKIYSKLQNLSIVTPSRWLADCVKRSPLLGRFPVEVIPNFLDTTVFFPEDINYAKKHYGIDPNKKIILFGALNATKDRLKGFDKLKESLQLIPVNSDTELAVFGSERRDISSLHGFKVHYFGHISNDKELRILYSAADVMVVPSLQEVFGQTATEAMSCGTPVVAFGATGLLDIISHKANGYLAEPFSAEDLARGILWCIENRERNQVLSENALKSARNRFEITSNIQKVISFYEHLIS